MRQKAAAEEAKRKAEEAARQKAAAEEAKRKAEEAARQKAAAEEKKNAAEKALAALREAGAEKYGGESFGKIVAQYVVGTNAFATASYADAGTCFDDVCAAAPECEKASAERRKIEAVDDAKNRAFAAQRKVLDAGGNKRFVKAWNEAVAALKSGQAKYVDHDLDGAKSDFEKSVELFAVFGNCLSLPQNPHHGQECALMLPGGEKIVMIYVAPGSFMMGSKNKDTKVVSTMNHVQDPHRVTLTRGYWLGKYEVTQKQWCAIMGDNPSLYKGDDNPVEGVSWNDCKEFLEKLNARPEVKVSGLTFRLPTEAEWEYACRAGSTGDYCKLADGTEITEDTLGEVAWYGGNSGRIPHFVGQKKSNAFGLYDMHGNVMEWCEDLYRAGNSGRVRRGGGWNYNSRYCSAGNRNYNYPGSRFSDLGFRLAASQDVNR